MGVSKEIFELGFKKLSKSAINFFDNVVPKTDHAGIIRAATAHPDDLTKVITHAESYVKNGDQRGLMPMMQKFDEWNREGVEATKQADTLSLGTTPAAKQDALYTRPDAKPRVIHEGVPRKGEAKQTAVIEHLQASDDPLQEIPYFKDKDGSLKYLDPKETNPETGEIRYAFRDKTAKLKDSSKRRSAKLEKTIPIEDYIEELGEELGTKAFKLNETKLKRLYRWVSKEGAHLDHISPLVGSKTEGFHHFNNLILLLAKDNLSKGKKALPPELFKELGIPLTKRDIIRSTLQKPQFSNKVKRQKILEALGIITTK